MVDSIWEIIANTLIENGIDVFPPSAHIGQCVKPYVMLKQSGIARIPGISSERVYYRFELYVPQNKYTYLDEFEFKVKKVLDEKLYPLLLPSGQQEPDYFDDNYDAHLRQFMYHNTRRNKHL